MESIIVSRTWGREANGQSAQFTHNHRPIRCLLGLALLAAAFGAHGKPGEISTSGARHAHGVMAAPAAPLATVTPSAFTLSVAADATATETLNIANATGADPLTFDIQSRGTMAPTLRLHVAATAASNRAMPRARLAGEQQPVQPTLSASGGSSTRTQPAIWAPVGPDGTHTFYLDDGSAETAIFFGNTVDRTEAGAVWLNRFSASGPLRIESVSVYWGDAALHENDPNGLQANIVAYYDADADGDPANAVRLGTDQLETIVSGAGFQTYTTNFNVPAAGDVYVGFVDQWAIAGGYLPLIKSAALDTDSPNQGASYLAASFTPPTDIQNLGNNNYIVTIDSAGRPGNWLIRATASGPGAGGPCTGPTVAWLSASPTSGSVDGGDDSDVTITVDPAAGHLTPADYSAELCITTNDPTQTLISIPVTLEVTAGAPQACDGGADEIFCDGFDGMVATYTDRADFLAHVAGSYYDNPFDDVLPGSSDDLTYTQGGWSYTIGTQLACDPTLPPDGHCLYNDTGVISTNDSADQIVVTFTGDPVTAVGGNFWAADSAFVPTGTDVVISLSNGTTETFTSTGPSDFRGFTTSAPITSITIDAPEVPGEEWSTMDNLVVGSSQ